MKVAPIFFVISSILYVNILLLINDIIMDPSCNQQNVGTYVIHSLVLIILIRILDKPANFKSNITYGYYS
jgi:hypothetical protein